MGTTYLLVLRSAMRGAPGLALVLGLLVTLAAAPTAAQGPIPKAPDADTVLAQAVQLHQAGDILGAIAGYQRYLESDPDNAGVRSNLGAAYVRLGKFEEGIAEYTRALTRDPANPDFRFNLALALYKAGEVPQAGVELEKVLTARRDHQNARLLLGDCYLRQGRFQDVIDLLAPWEDEFGADRGFAYVLGSAFIATDRLDHGQRLIERIFKDGESAEGHLLMGTVHQSAGDSPAALLEFKKALDLNPQLPVANGLLGRALMRNGEHEAALRAFLRELELNPNDFNANLEVGEIKKRDQLFDDARIYIERALRMRPRDATARFAMAGVHVSTGKTDEARQLLEGIVKDEPKYSEAYVLLATVYYRLQRREDGDRMRAMVEQLNAEKQARQPGARTPQ